AYVAKISIGANPQQALRALREAEAFEGTAIVICYAHCIAHGIDMMNGLHQQQLAVQCGHWPLLRYNPDLKEVGRNPFTMDSTRSGITLRDYTSGETRYKSLFTINPAHADEIMKYAQKEVDEKWAVYGELARRYEREAAEKAATKA
ncbi:MAG TPA: hypothetical protein PKI32_07070, partial [Opitutales bacterium]|nr:hypothetical protein [Opitutales bacterium]